jgi:glycosyltransferase involved in cell wall biosynthesis
VRRARERPVQATGKINVLFVQSQIAFGADSLVHAHLMRHLDRRYFNVHVACTVGSGGFVPKSLAAIRQIPEINLRPTRFAPGLSQRSLSAILDGVRGSFAFPLEFLDLLRFVRQNRIDVIHGTEKPRDATYAVVLGKLTGAKSVVHVHVKWSEEYSAPAKWAVRNASSAFSISRYVTETIVGMGTPARKIHTILNCLDASRWDPDIDGSSIRSELGIASDAPVLVSVSRLFSWKGQRELVRATALVRKRFPAVRVLIVGEDEPYVHGGSFTQELKELASSLGVTENVIFTGPRSDVAQIMAASDMYAMPSYEEPFGIVFLEAMAMRKPVIGVNNGGTPEVVEDGRAGLLSPPWDVERLAENILTLLEKPELRRSMGEYGRRRVLEYFTPERAARDAEAAYRALLNLPSPE